MGANDLAPQGAKTSVAMVCINLILPEYFDFSISRVKRFHAQFYVCWNVIVFRVFYYVGYFITSITFSISSKMLSVSFPRW